MRTIRIFLSSPGDVAAERALAREVIADLQKRYTGSFRLQPVFWEDLPLGSVASFQAGIDAVLMADGGIDIAVFMLWSRLGSPLGARIRKRDGSEYASGTEREWDLMLRAWEDSGGVRPDIFTYIRDDQNGFIEGQRGKDLSALRDMVEQQGRLRDFITEHFTDRQTGTNTRAFFTFHEPITFAHRLRTHLRAWLDQHLIDADLAAVTWYPAEQGSPFRGLEVFEYEHAPLFFGREQEVCDIQIRLRQQAEAGCAFVLLVGASGSGKSSLARAGVAPAVAEYDREDQAAEWRRAVFTPDANPGNPLLGLMKALAAAHALPELAKENLADIAAGLARDPELTWNFKLRPLFDGTHRRLLLIFDQVEELFTHGEISAEAQRKLGAALGVFARSGAIWIVATVRSDYYARFQAVPALLALKSEGAHLDLPPPAVAELQRIITQPARAAGLRFEVNAKNERLDARLLADAAEHLEALPLLEFCLDVLYQRQAQRGGKGQGDGVLRWTDYEAMCAAAIDPDAVAGSQPQAESGLAGALVSQAEKALASLPAEHQRQCLAAIFSKLLDLSATLEGETPVRRTALESELVRNPYPCGGDELPGARAFLEAFAAPSCRLLVSGATADSGGQGTQRTYTVAHEALLRNWWRLRRLQAEQAEFFRIRRQAERAQVDWLSAGRDDSFLLPEGLPIQLARRLAKEAPELLTGSLTEYINRSATRADRRRRRRHRLTAGVIAGLSFLAAGAGAGAWFGFRGEHEAQRQADIAQTKTKEAEARTAEAKAQIHQALVSDLATARHLLEKDNWREALLYLRRAQRYDDPDNRLVGASLWTEVVYGQGDRDGLPQCILKHKGIITSTVYSPDGTRILTASVDFRAQPGVQQWDAATGKPLGEPLRSEGGFESAAYSPDGTRILTASSDNTARQWDAASGKPLGEPLRHGDSVGSAAYSPDGARILTVCDDQTVRQWDAASGKLFGKPLHHEGKINHAAYNSDGTRIITLCEIAAQQWDAATGEPIGEPLRHQAAVKSAVYSPDGKRILTFDVEGIARQWEAATGKPIDDLQHGEDEFENAAYSPDGTRILTVCADSTTRQWETATGKPFGQPMHDEGVGYAAYSPDGTRILTGCHDGTARQWDAATCKPLGEPVHCDKEITDLAYSPDGTHFVLISFGGFVWQWDAAVGWPLGEPLNRGERVSSLAFNPDSTRYVTAPSPSGSRDTVRQRDAASGDPFGAPMRHAQEINSAAFSPDGTRIVTASEDKTAQQWDAATGKPLGEPMRHAEKVRGAVYSPDNTRILTASWDKSARQWDASTGKPIGEPLQHDSLVKAAIYSPDGTRILTTSGYTARQWDAATGKRLGEPLKGSSMSAAYSPDGKRIVTASLDDTAQQWDAATGETIGEPMRHERSVESVAYSPDGTRIVTVSNYIVQQWDVVTCKPLGEPLRNEHYVTGAAFSSDGTRLVTLSWEDPAKQWDCFLPSAPYPSWLDDFVQLLTGLRFDDNGGIQRLTFEERLALRTALQRRLDASRAPSNDWERLVRWTLAAPGSRLYTPNSTRSAPEVAALGLSSGRRDGIYAAIHLMPNLPLARLALAGLKEYADRADFLCRYELRHLPADDSVRFKALAMLRQQKQPQLALGLAREIATRAPKNAEAWRQVLAILRDELNRPAEAWPAGERLVALPDATVGDLVQIGLLGVEQKQVARGRELLREAAEKFPDDPVVYRFQGWAFVVLNLPAEALAAFQKSESLMARLAKKPVEDADTDLLAGLAVSRWLTGDKDGAVAEYLQLISAHASYRNKQWVGGLHWTAAEKSSLFAVLDETLRRRPELAIALPASP